MEISVGCIVEGKVREQRHMRVIGINERGGIEVEWFDESGRQTTCLPKDSVNFVSESATQEFVRFIEAHKIARMKLEKIEQERNDRRLRQAKRRVHLGKN